MKNKLLILFSLLVLAIMLFCSCNSGNTTTPPANQGGQGNGGTTEKLTITFDSNGGSPVSSVEINKGDKIPVPKTPTLVGYTFVGWCDAKDTFIWDFEKNVPIKSCTLKARWTITTFDITYVGAEGKKDSYTMEEEFTLEDGFLKSHDFLGWFWDKEFTKPFTKIEIGSSGDITLYAKTVYQPFDFELNEGGTYTLTKLRDDETNSVSIPATYNGVPVTHIGEKAFYNATKLETVTIAEGITHFGIDVFKRCNKLSSIKLPSTLVEIGEDSFYRCTSLEKIFIPKACVTIGKDVFYECDDEKLTIYCEAESQPSGFDYSWNSSYCKVEWNITYEDYENK
ncbi:MAG: leucine-rich repeat protein [Clostridia bacterium]|nr:leucine-rich repeat protein [Clostridia bacterium]